MSPFIILMLIGFGIGIIVFPICLGIYLLFKNIFMRRRIKKMLRKGQFLVPLDAKDFNSAAWKGHKYANIDVESLKDELSNLNQKIFKKEYMEIKRVDEKPKNIDARMHKALHYLVKVRELGYNDEFIMEEFKKKHYSDEFISQIFKHNEI